MDGENKGRSLDLCYTILEVFSKMFERMPWTVPSTKYVENTFPLIVEAVRSSESK
jgi:hypothetical protein